jgi:DNA modification methylase
MSAAYFKEHDVVLHAGHVLDVVAALPPESVHCVVTSPPYYGLRDYGVPGQIGTEPTPAAYVEALRRVFAEIRRVLRTDGTLWLNLGDCYAAAGGHTDPGVTSALAGRRIQLMQGMPAKGADRPRKSLLGLPWRVAFALQDDGWLLRNAIVWHKPNAMPESVRDRLACRYEHVFLFARSQRYWFDLDAIKVPTGGRAAGNTSKSVTSYAAGTGTRNGARRWGQNATSTLLDVHAMRNPGDVWQIATSPYRGAHFASFPPELARRCVRAGCPPGGTVLDPFCGSGTALLAARQLGRYGVGIDLNPAYLDQAVGRLGAPPLPFRSDLV